MAAPAKLTDADVKQIRRRVRRGKHQTELAAEFGVNRKTIRRRLDALDNAEREQAERTAKRRLHRQAARQRRELLNRQPVGKSSAAKHSEPPIRPPVQPMRPRSHYYDWLDRPKSLSGRALADANELVRLARGGDRRWVDRSDVDAYFDDGWVFEGRV